MSATLWLLLLATSGFAARYADWRALRQQPSRYHLVFGGALFCLLLWLMSVTMVDGLWMHFMGVTTLTLILGWRFAMLAGTVAILVYTLLIGEPLAAVAPAWLLTIAIPATVSRLLVSALHRLKSHNLFIYMLGAGFGGGMLSVLVTAIAAVSLLWLIGQQGWAEQALANWPLITLVLFPEGFINGMIVTALTVFYPDLVKTFDDVYYLDSD